MKDDYDVGTDKSGTVIVESTATGFTAYGITFQNDYNVTVNTTEGTQTPAVAFNSKADKVNLRNCSFIGRQDTLYVQGAGSRVYVNNCYVEGTVDFIFGDADALFDNCEIHVTYFPGKNNGYVTAPNTKKGNEGLVFYGCNLTASDKYTGNAKVTLGRPWQTEIYTVTVRKEDGSSYLAEYDPERKNPNYEKVSSAATFIQCTMSDRISSERWSVWTRKDANNKTVNITYAADVRFAEYNSMDEAGNLISSDSTVLGIMQTGETKTVEEVMEDLRMGIGVGLWDTEYNYYEIPETPVDPTTPEDGGAANNGNTDLNGDRVQNTANKTASNNSVPQTGDPADIILYIGFMIAAAIMGVTLKAYKGSL